jgi:thiamine pyrophosphate-dependent acetolactate synthase large subunit-like protein
VWAGVELFAGEDPAALLAAARRPVLLAGGGAIRCQAHLALKALSRSSSPRWPRE